MAATKRNGLRARLADKHVCICLGAGGVGKTTTSAALALGLAAAGQKVAVVTIDPAERLAAALGLRGLSYEPRQIDPQLFAAQGVAMEGEMWAMMLDAKRTLDDAVARLAPDEASRREILSNKIYRELSSAVAGSQELSAIVKLYELHHEGDFDVIVLDTPPSRNALDFLDAPNRMLSFLEGRALKMFIAPGGLTARLLGRSTGLVFSIFARVTGVDLLADLSVFFRSLSGVLDGFGERTREVAELLRDRDTTFLVVTSAETDPAREAVFLARRLSDAHMSRGGLIVNRFHSDGLGGYSAGEATALLEPELGDRLATRVAANLADFDVLARRDQASLRLLEGELHERTPVLVPHLDEDVHDLAGLARVAEHLLV
ncbi:MAG TPA: ArsA-related P-loop ATPase [Solirubrobacteraceae bacterium]|nr:ArsA-related P-loop ATPase [Solirubrobacteraceae bacterium]